MIVKSKERMFKIIFQNNKKIFIGFFLLFICDNVELDEDFWIIWFNCQLENVFVGSCFLLLLGEYKGYNRE